MKRNRKALFNRGGKMLDRKEHWEKIYAEKKPTEVSWYQQKPEKSLGLINAVSASKDASIIDMGGGASLLVDRLLDAGFKHVSVLDISENALKYTKQRLGPLAGKVHWIVSDATSFSSGEKYDIWHDRAVFHFLTEKIDREKYVSRTRESLKKGGFLILAVFAKDGPDKCSHLPVRQYDSALVMEEFEEDFELTQELTEVHRTPWGKDQKFNYFLLKKME
jgi:SAM-dependent methyltransferase